MEAKFTPTLGQVVQRLSPHVLAPSVWPTGRHGRIVKISENQHSNMVKLDCGAEGADSIWHEVANLAPVRPGDFDTCGEPAVPLHKAAAQADVPMIHTWKGLRIYEGDTAVIRRKIKKFNADETLELESRGHRPLIVPADDIDDVEMVMRRIQAGDVAWDRGGGKVIVISIDGEYAWARGYARNSRPTTRKLSDLLPADPMADGGESHG